MEIGAGLSSTTSANTTCTSTWMGFAARQLKERVLALEENQKLRDAIRGQRELASKLSRLFHNHISEKYTSLQATYPHLCPYREVFLKYWDFTLDADEDIFAEKLKNVARLRLELQQGVYQASSRPTDLIWGLSRGNMALKRHPTVNDGAVIEMHCGTTVPFKLEVAVRAYWRFFCLEHGEVPDCDAVANVPVR